MSRVLTEKQAARQSAPDFLSRALGADFEGEVRLDAFTRGRFSTDASIYQIMPAAVLFPKTATDIEIALKAARQGGLSVTMRGAGYMFVMSNS